MSIQNDKIMNLADGKVLYEDLRYRMAPAIIDKLTGNPVVFNDGVPLEKIRSMKVSFSPNQSGTGDPSPTNIRLITGRTGLKICRNNGNFLSKPDVLIDGWTNTLYGVTAVYNNGYLDVTGTSDPESGNWSNVVSFNTAFSNNPILLPPGDYSMPQGMTICITQNGASSDKASPFTLTENANLVGFYVAVYKDTQVNLHIPLTVVAGAERPTEYIEQEDSVYPVSWQSEAGEVYGGTLDALTGVLTVEWVPKTIRWGDVTKNPPGEFMTTGYIALDYETKLAGESGVSNEHKCNAAVWMWSGEANTTPHFYVYRGSSGKCTILVVLPNGTDEDLNIIVVSKLKEPYTVQLDPVTMSMMIGTNTIWTDSDNIEIAYPVDTKKYADRVDDKLSMYHIKDAVRNNSSVAYNGVITFGNGFYYNTNYHVLAIDTADSGQIKAGTNTSATVVTGKQHEASFYGLAKAAGDTTQSASSNAVGVYTPQAKSAIQNMIGVESGVSFIENVTGATPTINGVPNVKYECGELTSLTLTAPAHGTIDVWFMTGNTPTMLTASGVIFPSWFDPEYLEPNTTYEFVITDGYGGVTTWERPVSV